MANLTSEERAAFTKEIGELIEKGEFANACATVKRAAKADDVKPAVVLGSFVVASVLSGKLGALAAMENFLDYLCDQGQPKVTLQ